MRFFRQALWALTPFVTFALAASDAKDDAETDTKAASSSSTVEFLKTLKAGEVASADCWITLVNMTEGPLGSCLGLSKLATLLVNPSSNTSFAQQLNTYLTSTCKSGTCADADLSAGKAALFETCSDETTSKTALVSSLNAIIDNYSSSYHTLACSVHFNGTASLCMPSVLNGSEAANNNQFFSNLVSGVDLDQYAQSVFQSAECSGCMYEMYKAGVYTTPKIRGQTLTKTFGDHLQNDCNGAAGQDWSNVQDQTIPKSLTVQQSTKTGGAGQLLSKGSSHAILLFASIAVAAFSLDVAF